MMMNRKNACRRATIYFFDPFVYFPASLFGCFVDVAFFASRLFFFFDPYLDSLTHHTT